MSFRVVNPVRLLLLNSSVEGVNNLRLIYNHAKQLYYTTNDEKYLRVAEQIARAFFHIEYTQNAANNILPFIVTEYSRYSTRDDDHSIVNYIKKNSQDIFGIVVDGYYSPPEKTFHSEICIFNILQFLVRDYTDPNDFQYNPGYMNAPLNIKVFMRIMDVYHTYNIIGHSGHLLDHMTWCVLYTENLIRNHPSWFPSITPYEKFLVVSAALFHDIGKLNLNSPRTLSGENIVLYYNGDSDTMKHSDFGYTLLMNDTVINYKGNKLNIRLLLRTLLQLQLQKVPSPFAEENYCRTLAWVSKHHYELGYAYKQSNENPQRFMERVIDLINTTWYISYLRIVAGARMTYPFWVKMLIVASISDMLSTKSYLEPDKADQFSHEVSSVFPFIANRSSPWNPSSFLYDKGKAIIRILTNARFMEALETTINVPKRMEVVDVLSSSPLSITVRGRDALSWSTTNQVLTYDSPYMDVYYNAEPMDVDYPEPPGDPMDID